MKFLGIVLLFVAFTAGPRAAFDFAWIMLKLAGCVGGLLLVPVILVDVARKAPGILFAGCRLLVNDGWTVARYLREIPFDRNFLCAATSALGRTLLGAPQLPPTEAEWLQRNGWRADGGSLLGHLRTPNGSLVRTRIDKVGNYYRTVFFEPPFPHPCMKFIAPLGGYLLNPRADEVIPRTLEQAARTTTGWLFDNWHLRAAS